MNKDFLLNFENEDSDSENITLSENSPDHPSVTDGAVITSNGKRSLFALR